MSRLGFYISRYQLYTWVSLMHLLTDGWQFTSKYLHGLIHIWIVGAPHQMITPFSMFQDGRGLDDFTVGEKKYIDMYDIMKLVKRASKTGGGWEYFFPQQGFLFFLRPSPMKYLPESKLENKMLKN